MIGCLFAPFKFIWWSIRNGWKGWLLLAVVITLAVIAIIQVNNRLQPAPELTPQTTQNIAVPSIQDAPYILKTTSRVYLISTYHREPPPTLENIVLDVYWWFDGKAWIKATNLKMTKAGFGKVEITKR